MPVKFHRNIIFKTCGYYIITWHYCTIPTFIKFKKSSRKISYFLNVNMEESFWSGVTEARIFVCRNSNQNIFRAYISLIPCFMLPVFLIVLLSEIQKFRPSFNLIQKCLSPNLPQYKPTFAIDTNYFIARYAVLFRRPMIVMTKIYWQLLKRAPVPEARASKKASIY